MPAYTKPTMKVTAILALGGLAAAAPTPTRTFDGMVETPPPHPVSAPDILSTDRLVKKTHFNFSVPTPTTITFFDVDHFSIDPHYWTEVGAPPRSAWWYFQNWDNNWDHKAVVAVSPYSNPHHVPTVEPRAEPTAPAAPSESANGPLDATLDDFKANASFSQLAQEEAAPYPYERVFFDQNATAIHQPIETHFFEVYDANRCAAHCNEHRACRAFGVFIERLSSCTDCDDPAPWEANVCELYNTPLERGVVTDGSRSTLVQGGTFTRAVRASNGYNKIAPRGMVTSYRTVTFTTTLRETASFGVSLVNGTTTVTATTTLHHTAPASITTLTSTHSAQRNMTVTETETRAGPTQTVTVDSDDSDSDSEAELVARNDLSSDEMNSDDSFLEFDSDEGFEIDFWEE